jgi:LytS/YehU family sensor histidine kinase
MVEEVERSRISEMQRLVSQAELRALQAQINPHFLFNALNTLYGIIPKDAAGARKTVRNLADIFRYFLHSGKALIPLSEELEIVRAYLDIERLRLGPRLETDIDVDEALLGVLIPVLSLQPLVENAVKHGISARPGQGWLKIRAKLAGQEAVISVEDSGSGSTAGPQPGAGVGLANVTRRLQLCYGPQADVTIRSDASGTTAQFSVSLSGAASSIAQHAAQSEN